MVKIYEIVCARKEWFLRSLAGKGVDDPSLRSYPLHSWLRQSSNWLVWGLGGSIALPAEQTDECSLKSQNALALTMAANPSNKAEPPLNARVLLAEDHPIDRLILREMLERLGCRADIVADGRGVVEMVATGAYALVIMDIRMPVIDGFQATEKIREFESTESAPRRIPIIALTADALEGSAERCRDAGMDDRLIKPVTVMQLRQTLENWLIQDDAHQGSQGMANEPEPASVECDTVALEAGGFLLDQKALDNIRAVQQEGSPSVLDKVIKIFFEDSPKLLQALRDAVAEDNGAEMIERAAHSLKSSSANLGVTRLAELCRDLEEMARENRTHGAKALLDEIERLYPMACERLAAECETAAG